MEKPNHLFCEITSKTNPKVKHAAKLVESAKYRRACGQFIAQTPKIIFQAVENGIAICSLFATMDEYNRYFDFICSQAKTGCEIFIMNDDICEKISDMQSPQGMLAICQIPEALDKSESTAMIYKGKRYVALENIQDPGNLGTMIRTARALGFDGVLLGETCVDLYSPKVIRATMGAFFGYPVYIGDVKQDFYQVLCLFKTSGFSIYGTILSEQAKRLGSFPFAEKSVVVIGNEANGITRQVALLCNDSVMIPMSGGIQSLNAAAAASIVMWELTRNRFQTEID